MAWFILLLSAVLEAVWATALGESEGFSRPIPTLIFYVACILSGIGLGWAMKEIPVGTAYAVWTGVGSALTVAWAMATGNEDFSWLKVLFLAGIIGATIGLRMLPAEPKDEPKPEHTDGKSGDENVARRK